MKYRNIGFFILIFSIVIALFIIYHLPSDIRKLLVLRSDSLSLIALFACHFVHEDFVNHLLPNIFAYFVTVLPLYWFLLKLNEKRFFYKLFAFNCLAMPFILSLIWIGACAFWNAQTRSCGFSGINSAFLGAFIFAYALFLHETLKVDMHYANLSAMFFVALIFTLIYPTLPLIPTIAIVIALLAVFAICAHKIMKSINLQAKNKHLLLYLYLLILSFSIDIFPTQIIQGNVMVNSFIHYAGFVLGIGTAQLIWQYSHKA